MSTINVAKLVLALQQKIDSSTTENELLYYTKALNLLNLGSVKCVNSRSNLGIGPGASQGPGCLFYVEAEKSLYFSSGASSSWIGLSEKKFNPLYSWGANNCGQLGINASFASCSSSTLPVREACRSNDWCSVVARATTRGMFAQKRDGTVWGWGTAVRYGLLRQFCDGTTSTTAYAPVQEGSLISWKSFCKPKVGTRITALKQDGTLWSWGCRSGSVFGDGTTLTNFYAAGNPRQEITKSTWKDFSAGANNAGGIKSDGSLWIWGNNITGQIGDGTTVNRCSPVRERCSATNWCSIELINNSTISLKTDGSLWAWGTGDCGLRGDGITTVVCSPVRERCSATNWCDISASPSHITAAIKTDGSLWVWGNGNCGGLGDGTTVSKCSPVREFCSATNWCFFETGVTTVANPAVVAIKTDGSLWRWGQAGTFATSACSAVRETTNSTDWCTASIMYNAVLAIKNKTLY